MQPTFKPALTQSSVRRKRHEELEAVTLTPPESPRPSPKFRMGSGKLLKSRGESGSSTPGSPRSVDMMRGVSSPLRSSRASTTDDESIKIDKQNYQHMFQDIVSIKTMLLKLKRVLSESEGGLYENGIKLFPDEGTFENGADEMADLRRQVVFLQQQLEEREKTVQNLQLEINKNIDGTKSNGTTDSKEQCNAATQTDRVRPVSTGPSILQNLPSDSGSLVSHSLSNSRLNSLSNSKRPKNEIAHDEGNTKGFVSVKGSHVDKILEKVKELSFKPVEVLEKEESQSYKNGCQSLPRDKQQQFSINNGTYLYSRNGFLKEPDSKKSAEPFRKPSQNVFKITKIDLVLKSDNYGKRDLSKSNR